MCFTFCTRFRASRGVRIKVRLTGSLPMAGLRGLGQMHRRSLGTAMARVTWRSRANACDSATDAPKRRSSGPLSLSAAVIRSHPGGAASRSFGAEGLDAGNARQPHAINFATVDDAAVHQVVEFRKTDAGHFCPRLRANPDRLDVFSGVHEISSGSFAAAQRQPGYCIRGKLSG